MRVVDDHVGANDLSQVVLTNHEKNIKYNGILTDLIYNIKRNRRKRKVRKLDFEER